MSISNNDHKVLVLTVGTGNAKDKENSLYVPLQKSIGTDCWDRVILFPSQQTVEDANEVKRRISEISVEVRPIPNTGDENDADASFAHFDAILGELIESDGVFPRDITLDFTRGTKAMSAALVLAGVARSVPVLRYIEGKRGKRGNVLAGSEVIMEVRTEVANARQRINLAERLMIRGDFEAICTMHKEISSGLKDLPEQLSNRLNAYAYVADIYASWDRFDYGRACSLIKSGREIISSAGQFEPTRDMEQWIKCLASLAENLERYADWAERNMEQWIKCLASHPNQDKLEEISPYVMYLACDLLANAERRYRDGLYEDSGVRWYRLLELIGQARLFDQGYDSSRLPEDNPKVKEFNDRLSRKSQALNKGKQGTLLASRLQVAIFLKRLGDPLSKRLLQQDNSDYVVARNHGLLAHGFNARAYQMTSGRVRAIIKNFEQLLCEDRPEAHEWLAVARSLDFSSLREN